MSYGLVADGKNCGGSIAARLINKYPEDENNNGSVESVSMERGENCVERRDRVVEKISRL